MVNIIKKIYNKIEYIKAKSSSLNYQKYLVKKGAVIGKNSYFFSPKTTIVDEENAHFITIGDKCKITSGVVILAHDYSYSVLRPLYNDIPKKAGLTTIGDNVFIGINSIILMGSKIGNNVIIGAGSVVSGKIPDNEVWAGNPARFICTIEDYYKKCKNSFENGAILTINQYNKRFNRYPTISELQYYSLLFINNSYNNVDVIKELNNMSFNGDDKSEVLKDCLDFKSKYKNYEELKSRAKNSEKVSE